MFCVVSAWIGNEMSFRFALQLFLALHTGQVRVLCCLWSTFCVLLADLFAYGHYSILVNKYVSMDLFFFVFCLNIFKTLCIIICIFVFFVQVFTTNIYVKFVVEFLCIFYTLEMLERFEMFEMFELM